MTTSAMITPVLADTSVSANLFTYTNAVLPEICVLVAVCMLIIAQAALSVERTKGLSRLAMFSLVFPLIVLFAELGNPTQYAWSNMVVVDDLARWLKIFSIVAVGVTMVYCRDYATARGIGQGEFYALMLFALIGMLVMISANNMLIVYVGLELLSLSMYSIAALHRDNTKATEAAMKYFVLGALASGFLLYGMSMVYGGTGTLDLTRIAQVLAAPGAINTAAAFGVVFLVAGLAFKFGAVPFHMWVPDVYEGTPTAATLLIAGAPKMAAFAIAYRLLGEALISIAQQWQEMLALLAVASVVIGNLVAIAQTNIKRMLAYSTISHVGFILMGLLSGVVATKTAASAGLTSNAYGAAMFYTVTYVLTTLATFGVILMLSRSGHEADQVDDFKGLWHREPWLAFVMLVLMLSLAGIPLTVGFPAKYVVLEAVVASCHVWLAVVAVLASLIGAFYYLRVIKVMFFEAAIDKHPITAAPDARFLLGLNGMLAVALGLLPGPLLDLCTKAIKLALAT
jgi:NADH-quinone oxidoreductase subunit N